jgi:NitT/TauT family transport system substrate-binding protein
MPACPGGAGMKRLGALALAATLALALAACGDDETASSGSAEGGGKIRVALGDIESVETLGLMIALERVRKRGTEVELIELADEDLANQAVVGGQADVGLGAPYGLIEGSGAPLRIFCQLQKIRFFPVADKAAYPDWQSLDGETFTVHSRGSTTEALAHIIEQEEGIEFGKVSYVPGAEVRATALVRGNVKAAVLDIPNKNYVMSEAPGKFHVLPTPESGASDEVLFGNTAWIEKNQQSVQVLLEEILATWRAMSEDPQFVLDERKRLGLLKDLPPELEEELLPYYEQAGEEGLFTQDCGGEAAAREDFEFYNAAGQLKGDPASLKVEDFWSLEPAKAAAQNADSQ